MSTSLTRFSLYVIARKNNIRRKKEKNTTIKDKSLAGHSDLIQLSISFLFFFSLANFDLFFFAPRSGFPKRLANVSSCAMGKLSLWKQFQSIIEKILQREYVRDDEDDWRNGRKSDVRWNFRLLSEIPEKRNFAAVKNIQRAFFVWRRILNFECNFRVLQSFSPWICVNFFYKLRWWLRIFFFVSRVKIEKNQVEVCGRIKKRDKKK